MKNSKGDGSCCLSQFFRMDSCLSNICRGGEGVISKGRSCSGESSNCIFSQYVLNIIWFPNFS